MLRKLFARFFGSTPGTTDKPADLRGVPIVKFDPARVTEVVKADVKATIASLPEIDARHSDHLYDAAIQSISRGRDLHLLASALLGMNIDGMTRTRAAEIARLLNNRATSIMNRERQSSLGISTAIWLYSGDTNDQGRAARIHPLRGSISGGRLSFQRYSYLAGTI